MQLQVCFSIDDEPQTINDIRLTANGPTANGPTVNSSSISLAWVRDAEDADQHASWREAPCPVR